jgi:hypothetical protein
MLFLAEITLKLEFGIPIGPANDQRSLRGVAAMRSAQADLLASIASHPLCPNPFNF